ncbi:MAG: hypothetical protein AB7L91_19475, partial [Dehalococcoidia bacterium]
MDTFRGGPDDLVQHIRTICHHVHPLSVDASSVQSLPPAPAIAFRVVGQVDDRAVKGLLVPRERLDIAEPPTGHERLRLLHADAGCAELVDELLYGAVVDVSASSSAGLASIAIRMRSYISCLQGHGVRVGSAVAAATGPEGSIWVVCRS